MGKDFRDLEVYQIAEDFIVKIYEVSKNFPKEEIYGITSQLHRAVVSIALNIAESYGRYHYKEKILFLYNARGSLLETKSIILICFRLKYLSEKEKDDLIIKIDNLGIKLNNFISYLRNRKSP